MMLLNMVMTLSFGMLTLAQATTEPSQAAPLSNTNSNTNTNCILPDITAAIGNTPLVDLSRITRHYGVEGRILGKCECMSPGFSKKDRIAKQIIKEALSVVICSPARRLWS